MGIYVKKSRAATAGWNTRGENAVVENHSEDGSAQNEWYLHPAVVLSNRTAEISKPIDLSEDVLNSL